MDEPFLRSVAKVNKGLAQARTVAAEHKLPLTIERIAACLGISRKRLLAYIRDEVDDPEIDGKRRAKIHTVLWQAFCDCEAELAEEMLKPGSHTGAVFLGKNNFGYCDREERDAEISVTFVGEENMKE